jgi:WD40 repeat protein
VHITDGDKIAKTLDDAEEWIQAAAFSPDSSKLAVGSHDNKIYIY